MFWFIDGKTAYGGRAGLFPLLSAIIQANGSALESNTSSLIFLPSSV